MAWQQLMFDLMTIMFAVKSKYMKCYWAKSKSKIKKTNDWDLMNISHCCFCHTWCEGFYLSDAHTQIQGNIRITRNKSKWFQSNLKINPESFQDYLKQSRKISGLSLYTECSKEIKSRIFFECNFKINHLTFLGNPKRRIPIK